MQPADLELRATRGRGDGVFATRAFGRGETVLIGEIACHLDGNSAHASQVGPCEYVLLAGLGPMVNHSCDPNCGVSVNESGAYDLVARRDIAGGEEITFDYAMRNYTIERFPAECRCGTPKCRGSVSGWRDLPREVKSAYAGLVAPYLLEMDARAVSLCPSRGDT